MAEQAKGVGRPKVGGAFNLIDQEGKEFSDGDMKGGFSIVGFCFLFPFAIYHNINGVFPGEK